MYYKNETIEYLDIFKLQLEIIVIKNEKEYEKNY